MLLYYQLKLRPSREYRRLAQGIGLRLSRDDIQSVVQKTTVTSMAELESAKALPGPNRYFREPTCSFASSRCNSMSCTGECVRVNKIWEFASG